AARFEFDAVSSQRDGLPYLSGRHVVEQNYVYSVEFDERTNLFQVISLHFDADVWSFLAELANSTGKTGESLESSQMIIFHEHHFVQTKTVVAATPGNYRSFLQYTQPRCGFSRIQDLNAAITNGVCILTRQCRYAAQMLQ